VDLQAFHVVTRGRSALMIPGMIAVLRREVRIVAAYVFGRCLSGRKMVVSEWVGGSVL
jgi:hypothetical protein